MVNLIGLEGWNNKAKYLHPRSLFAKLIDPRSHSVERDEG